MINFRYHVVSLVAVFLALGLGLLAGASFISEVVVDAVRAQRERQGRDIANLRKEVLASDKAEESFAGYASLLTPELISGKLLDQRVVIVGFASTEGNALEDVASTLQAAGASVQGVLALSESFDLSTEARREQVGLALDEANIEEESLRIVLQVRLAEALAGQAPGLLGRLTSQDLAQARQAEGVIPLRSEELPAPNSLVVLVAAGAESPLRAGEQLLAPIARSLSAAGVVVAVCETSRGELATVSDLRGDANINVVTVDGVEQPFGTAALALGLNAALEGRYGHYGTGPGASGLLPVQAPNG